MSFYVSTATFVLLHCDEWDRVVALPRHKFVTGATLLQLPPPPLLSCNRFKSQFSLILNTLISPLFLCRKGGLTTQGGLLYLVICTYQTTPTWFIFLIWELPPVPFWWSISWKRLCCKKWIKLKVMYFIVSNSRKP